MNIRTLKLLFNIGAISSMIYGSIHGIGVKSSILLLFITLISKRIRAIILYLSICGPVAIYLLYLSLKTLKNLYYDFDNTISNHKLLLVNLVLFWTWPLWMIKIINSPASRDGVLSSKFSKFIFTDSLLKWNPHTLLKSTQNLDNTVSNFTLAFPHGFAPWNQVFANKEIIGNKYLHTFVDKKLMNVPLLGPIATSFCGNSIQSIDKQTLLKYFDSEESKKYISLLFTGGFNDTFHTEHGVMGVYPSGKKGFLKMCLEKGANLNLSYTYNIENIQQSYLFDGKPWVLTKKIQDFFRYIAHALHFLPKYNVPLATKVVHFMKVDKMDKVTPEAVNELYDKMVEAIVKLAKSGLEYTSSKKMMII